MTTPRQKIGFMVYLLLGLILTLKPFDFSLVHATTFIEHPFKELLEAKPYDVIGNILFFVPLGGLLAMRPGILSNRLFCALGYGALISLGIETAQIFLSRTTSLIDLLTNTFGAGSGALLWILHQRKRTLSPLLRLWHARPIRIIGSCLYSLFLFVLFLLPTRTNRLSNWDDSYPFLIGNEGTGDRPWLGTIKGLLIYDRALRPDEIRLLKDATKGEAETGEILSQTYPLLFYPMTEGAGKAFHNRIGPDFPLLLPENGMAWDQEGGLTCQGGSISHPRLGRWLTERCRVTSSFSIVLWIKAQDLVQTGPARIVSVSKNPDRRNFTLGQEGHALVFRVRSPQNGKNGARLPYRASFFLNDTHGYHVGMTYDHGVIRCYRDGHPFGKPRLIHQDYLTDLFDFGPSPIGWFAFCLVVLGPWQLLLFSLFRSHPLVWTLVLTALFVLAVEGFLLIRFGQPWTLALILPALGSAGMLGVIGANYRKG